MSAIQLAPVAITPTHPNPGAGFKLKELIQAKDERIAERASPAMFKTGDIGPRRLQLCHPAHKFSAAARTLCGCSCYP